MIGYLFFNCSYLKVSIVNEFLCTSMHSFRNKSNFNIMYDLYIKSSLLTAMIGQLTTAEGIVRIGGKVNFATQQAWIFSETIRENILFGESFEKDKYEQVIRACALDKVNAFIVFYLSIEIKQLNTERQKDNYMLVINHNSLTHSFEINHLYKM